MRNERLIVGFTPCGLLCGQKLCLVPYGKVFDFELSCQAGTGFRALDSGCSDSIDDIATISCSMAHTKM
jgi:hypothetical protein